MKQFEDTVEGLQKALEIVSKDRTMFEQEVLRLKLENARLQAQVDMLKEEIGLIDELDNGYEDTQLKIEWDE